MTVTIWVLLAVTVAVVIGIGTFIAVGKARAESVSEQTKRAVATPCARSGHSYQPYETGFRCGECGNHVARIEGEVYGAAEDGLRERRRERR